MSVVFKVSGKLIIKMVFILECMDVRHDILENITHIGRNFPQKKNLVYNFFGVPIKKITPIWHDFSKKN